MCATNTHTGWKINENVPLTESRSSTADIEYLTFWWTTIFSGFEMELHRIDQNWPSSMRVVNIGMTYFPIEIRINHTNLSVSQAFIKGGLSSYLTLSGNRMFFRPLPFVVHWQWGIIEDYSNLTTAVWLKVAPEVTYSQTSCSTNRSGKLCSALNSLWVASVDRTFISTSSIATCDYWSFNFTEWKTFLWKCKKSANSMLYFPATIGLNKCLLKQWNG